MNEVEQIVYRLAFSRLRGMTVGAATSILEALGSEEAFFTASPQRLAMALGNPRHPYADSAMRDALVRDARTELGFIETNGVKCLYFTDPCYPRRLAMCEDAPLMLFGLGDADLNSAHVVSVVGTRRATAYGLSTTESIVSGLASRINNLVVVSGLAFGIDIAAHRAALAAGVPTVGVVAHGLNTLYPPQHRQTAARMVGSGGMVLTEYRSSDALHKGNFLARNRIVAGMADCTVVVESAEKGGALFTARIASDYSREVVAVPGRVSDSNCRGCLKLIASQSAHVFTDVDAMLELMGWEASAAAAQPSLFPEMSPEEERIIDMLHTDPTLTVNDLSARLPMPMAQLRSKLIDMEFRELLMALPGARYAPKV